MSQENNVRVRFAPSPTGPLHIGGVRTALYNYLFARQNNGVFVLRVEDTDQKRYVAGAEDYIINSLEWLGMLPDESPKAGGEFGPYRQSERRAIYEQHIKVLLSNGTAYYAFDTPEELEAMRERLTAEGIHSPKYDHQTRQGMRNSLTLSESDVNTLLSNGAPYTVRLKVDSGKLVKFDDRVRGEITFNTDELDDKVLMKADGLPTYHFANVVDDHLMQISHVIRGEEWLSSTPHHALLYRAFGWEDSMPEFAHLPLILKPSGKGKLSKRDGAKFGFPVFPLDWPDDEEIAGGFMEAGFMPEALLNFLAFLGWNPGTEQELFSMAELFDSFDLDKITKSGARFDYDKAKWFNAQHIKRLTTEELASRLQLTDPTGQALAVLGLYQDRVESLNDFEDIMESYRPDTEYKLADDSLVKKKWDADIQGHFRQLHATLGAANWSDPEDLSQALKNYVKSNGLKFGDVFRLMRTSLVGSDQGPDLVEMMLVLGRDESLERIDHSIGIFEDIAKG